MRRHTAVLIAVLVAAASGFAGFAAAIPVGAGAATTPDLLSPGNAPTAAVSTATTTATSGVTTSTTGSSGLSRGDAIAIAIVTVALLGGIAFYVWFDARRHAPARSDSLSAEGGPNRKGSKAPPKPRKLSPAERRRRRRGKAR